jgi:transcription elongation factor Elf1
MMITDWLAHRRRSKIDLRRKRTLEGRIVLCVDCDGSRVLTVSSSGNLICSSCGSEHWMFVAVPLFERVSEYNEPGAWERLAVDRYIARLEQEALSASCEAKT